MTATQVTSGFGVLLKRGDGGAGAAVAASRVIGTGTSGFTIAALEAGTAGNSLACSVVVSGLSTALSVTVTASNVTITSKTDGAGAATSTVNDIIAELYQDSTFRTYWSATATSTGLGVIAGASALAFLTGGTAGGEVFTTVAEVTGLGGPSEALELIDATHMESPSGYREYIPSLKDSGEISVDLNFLPADTNQGGLRDDLVARELRNWQLVWTDTGGTTYAFSGYVTAVEPKASIDDKLSASATIKVTGPITVS